MDFCHVQLIQKILILTRFDLQWWTVLFWLTHVLFWGHWNPCCGFLVTSPLGFKAKVGSALFAFYGGECNVHSPRSTSGATCADLLVAGAEPVTYPHACAEVGLGSDLKGKSPEQKTNALPLCQRPGGWWMVLTVDAVLSPESWCADTRSLPYPVLTVRTVKTRSPQALVYVWNKHNRIKNSGSQIAINENRSRLYLNLNLHECTVFAYSPVLSLWWHI